VEGVTEGINFKSKASEKQAKELKFTERQASAILELRLQKLIGLEVLALQQTHEETLKKIADYTEILSSKDAMMRTIKKDLDRIRKNYGVKRRTRIADLEEAVYEEEAPQSFDAVFTANRFGYVKLIEDGAFQRNEEAVRAENNTVISCTSTSRIWVFTKEGSLHTLKMSEMPLSKPKDKGTPLDNLSNFVSAEETVAAYFNCADVLNEELIFLTEQGFAKRTVGLELDSIKRTVAATKLGDKDALVGVFRTEKT
jgi:DNA gyrase subunit A